MLLPLISKLFAAFFVIRSAFSLLLHHSVLLRSSLQTVVNKDAIIESKATTPVVIMYGLLGSARNFNTFSRMLHQKLHSNHDVIVMDLRGHGRTNNGISMTEVAIDSERSLSLAYEAMAQDVIDTLAYLGISRVHLVGHSMGGKVAAAIALQHPQTVQSLAMLDIRLYPQHVIL